MKLKLKRVLTRVHEVTSCFQLDAILFPDYESILLSTSLADFLRHCEMLGLNLKDGFTVDDGKGDTE